MTFFCVLDFTKFNLYAKNFSVNAFNSFNKLYRKYIDLLKLRSKLSIIYLTKKFQKPHIHDLINLFKRNKFRQKLTKSYKIYFINSNYVFQLLMHQQNDYFRHLIGLRPHQEIVKNKIDFPH